MLISSSMVILIVYIKHFKSNKLKIFMKTLKMVGQCSCLLMT